MAMFYFFFFQAEDGIRGGTVTGVQTCALPILGDVRLHQGGQVETHWGPWSARLGAWIATTAARLKSGFAAAAERHPFAVWRDARQAQVLKDLIGYQLTTIA